MKALVRMTCPAFSTVLKGIFKDFLIMRLSPCVTCHVVGEAGVRQADATAAERSETPRSRQ